MSALNKTKAAKAFVETWRWEDHGKRPIHELVLLFQEHQIMVREFIRIKSVASETPAVPAAPAVSQQTEAAGDRPKIVIRRHSRASIPAKPVETLEWNAPDDRWWALSFPDGSMAYLLELWPMKAQMIVADSQLPDYITAHLAKGRSVDEVWSFTPHSLVLVGE
jgi:hypothetical protein